MISNQVQREIKRRMPGIIESYGGVVNFLSYVREFLHIPSGVKESGLSMHSKTSLYTYLNTLITFSNDIVVISPWSLFIDLRDTLLNETVANGSINIEEPYRVYTLEGDLIYTVKNHFGAFGESRLDKQLIINSSNATAYYLKFKTYSGKEKIKLLLVNMYSRHSMVSNQLLRKPPAIETSTISFVNNTGEPLKIYFIRSSIITDAEFNFQQDQYLNVIEPNNIKLFNVDQSSYFFLGKIVNIERTVITNPLNDLVFQTRNSQLLFVGTNVDVNLLNKVFNQGIQYSNKPLQEVITLTSI